MDLVIREETRHNVPSLLLPDDEGDVVARITLRELADWLAPYLKDRQ